MKYLLHKVEFLFFVPTSQYLTVNLNAARQGESFMSSGNICISRACIFCLTSISSKALGHKGQKVKGTLFSVLCVSCFLALL